MKKGSPELKASLLKMLQENDYVTTLDPDDFGELVKEGKARVMRPDEKGRARYQLIRP